MADPKRLSGRRKQAHEDSEMEQAEQRRARRLTKELGINSAGIQVVIHLRRQVVELQGRVQQLESELRIERSQSNARLARYRRDYREATWEETL